MSKLRHQELQVSCSREGIPVRVCWSAQAFVVERVLDCWCDTGCWWEGESEKRFYRLCLENGSVLEIYQDFSSRTWVLYKVYD